MGQTPRGIDKLKNYYEVANIKMRLEKSPYIPTQIQGFDDLLRGGLLLPNYNKSNDRYNDNIGSLVILIKGQPGSGKTTFATQILSGIMQCNKSKNIKNLQLSGSENFYCSHPESPDHTFVSYTNNTKGYLDNSTKPMVFSCEHNEEEYYTLLSRLQSKKLSASAEEKIKTEFNTDLIIDKWFSDNFNSIIEFKSGLNNLFQGFDTKDMETELDATLSIIITKKKEIGTVTEPSDSERNYFESLINIDEYNRMQKTFWKLVELKIKYWKDDVKKDNKDINKAKEKIEREFRKVLNEVSSEFKPNRFIYDIIIHFMDRMICIIEDEVKAFRWLLKNLLNSINCQNKEVLTRKLIEDAIVSIEDFLYNDDVSLDLETVFNEFDKYTPIENERVEFTSNYMEITDRIELLKGSGITKINLKSMKVILAYLLDKFNKLREQHFANEIDSLKHDLEIETLTHSNYNPRVKDMKIRTYDVWLSDMMKYLGDFPKEGQSKLRVILIDGLNSFPPQIRRDIDAQLIVRYLRKCSLVSIIVYEDEKDHHENLDYLADMVIKLEGKEHKDLEQYYLNRLSIEKSRFQQAALGWHQYKIGASGVAVFPSIHFRTHRLDKLNEHVEYSMKNICNAYRDSQALCTNATNFHHPSCESCSRSKDPKGISEMLFGIDGAECIPEIYPSNEDKGKFESLITKLMNGQLRRGSTTAILGAHHTFKKQLSLDFLRTGSMNDEHGLLISLQDIGPELYNEKGNLCRWICKDKPDKIPYKLCSCNNNCFTNVHSLILRPGCITPAEFISHLERRFIEGIRNNQPIRRVVLWDLNHLESRFPFFAQNDMFLPALIDYLKYCWAITTLIVGPSNTLLARRAYVLVDNAIFTWRDHIPIQENGNEVDQECYVFYCERVQHSISSISLTYLKIEKGGNSDNGKWSESLFVHPNKVSTPIFTKIMRRRIREIQAFKGIETVCTIDDNNIPIK